MASAAFFDLDRTLLCGGSGPVLSAALAQVGLGASVPGAGTVFRVFDTLGETRTSMLLAKQGPRAAKGWPRSVVQRAARAAVDPLLALVQPYARRLIADHQDRGDAVVLATTTPFDVIEPFAQALGLDDVIATRFHHIDGVYDGTFDGGFVWGPGKLRAVRTWMAANDVAAAASTAYSDSWFDAPLLSEVGHPVAVNPDPRLAALARVRRWPVRHLDVPAGVPKVLGQEPVQLARPLLRSGQSPFAVIESDGLDHLPAIGPAIVAANHRSYFDPFVLSQVLARTGRPGRFLAKRELFDAAISGDLAASLGAIPVDRGTGSDEPLVRAEEALAAGEVVVILPQGTIPRGPEFFSGRLRGRTGVARLAKLSGAPVIPVGLWGTEVVWPRSSRLPRVVAPWRRPTVGVRMGPPVDLKGRSEARDTERVLEAITALLPPRLREPTEPTEADLAATYPPGG